MDTARFVVAVLTWVGFPPAVIYWFIIHPFADRWRRIGVVPTMVIVSVIFVAIGVVFYLIHDMVLVTEFGTHWSLWVVALISYVTSVGIELQCRKHLKFRMLAGIPELEADQSERKLLNEGIYSRVRHPRYVSVTFGVLAMALFSNYLAVWVMIPTLLLALYIVAVLEERELVQSLGDRYREYQRQVPMFIPRLGRNP